MSGLKTKERRGRTQRRYQQRQEQNECPDSFIDENLQGSAGRQAAACNNQKKVQNSGEHEDQKQKKKTPMNDGYEKHGDRNQPKVMTN